MAREVLGQYWEQLRLKGAGLIAAGAVALTGCSAGPQETPAPASAMSSVEAGALPIEEYDLLSADELARDIESQPDAAQRYKRLINYDPTTGREIKGDFPVERSASLLTITYNKKYDRLVYQDSTPDSLSEAEGQLLGTVQANAPLLEAAMSSGRVNSFRFRQFEAPYSAASYEAAEKMAFMPYDYSAGADKPRQSNIYYFLPYSGSLDAHNMEQMNRHEALHAASDHNLEMNLTPGQETRYAQACEVLRQGALQTMRIMGSSSASALDRLSQRAPAALRPAFQSVMEAIRSGTYGELPWSPDDHQAQIPECFIQTPMDAVYQQIERLGLNEMYGQFVDQTKDDQEVSDLLITIQDDWSHSLETLTVYKIFNESQWLHVTPASADNGHVQDGWHEIAASGIDRLFGDTEAFALDVKLLSPETRQAALEILDLSQEVLEEKYKTNKNDRDLIKQLRDKRAAFDKVLRG